MAIEAVIFDFGGVIIPGSPAGSDPNSPLAVLERSYGLPAEFLWRAVYVENPEWMRLRVGDSSPEAWLAQAHATIAAALDDESATAIVKALDAQRPQGAALEGKKPEFIPGMLDLIRRLRETQRVGLLSNAAPGLEEELRGHYGIYDLFHDVINSATVRLAKPDPRVYHLAAERLGVSIERCFFTDDLPHNIESARAAGMTAHCFDGFAGLVGALQAAGVPCTDLAEQSRAAGSLAEPQHDVVGDDGG